MDEVFRISDRITVLRDGGVVLTEPVADLAPEQIVAAIVGREVDALEWEERPAPSTGRSNAAAARGSRPDGRERRDRLSFRLHAGEILGLAGLMGSGRTELARRIFGIDRSTSGRS